MTTRCRPGTNCASPSAAIVTSFTGDLLRLIAKADPGNRARLRAGFPKHVAAWEMWQASPDGGLTSGQLHAALASVPDR